MDGCFTHSNVRSWFLAISAAFVLMAPANGVSVPEIRIEPTTLYFGAATPGETSARPRESSAQEDHVGLPAPGIRPEKLQSLREKAAKERTVRVIVRLAAAFTPEGRLANAQAARDQRLAIDQVQDVVLKKLEKTPVRLHARFEYIPFLALEVDSAALDHLAALPEVDGLDEDVASRVSLASSTAVVGAGVAWASGWTGDGQVIAVLDTGVDKAHPYFSSGGHNKVVSEACYSSQISGTTSLCPGGVQESTAPGSGVNCSLSNSYCAHGTHVAGIAAGNDGTGPNFGVARDADLIAIQVFSSCGDFCVLSWVSDQIKGLERVYALAGDFDIAAVNMSLSENVLYSSRSSCDQDNAARKAAIDNLRSIDIATVASSGNNGYFGFVSSPGCISSVVGVGATDDSDQVPFFSNIASFLDLLAPGVSIQSAAPGGDTFVMDGTSMAAAHAVGAWAVLKQANPGATVSSVLDLLRSTAVPVNYFGYDLRRINLGRAIGVGPLDPRSFTIHNDGGAVLSILSMQLQAHVPWVRWSPEAPFDIPPGGAKTVKVTVDFGAAPGGASANRLLVGSNDGDESPYPNAVLLAIDKQPCYPLTRVRTGNGGNPAPGLGDSPGCPLGQYHAGQLISLSAHPWIGFSLASWSGTDQDGSVSLTNSLTMPAAPHTVSVTYQLGCFALALAHIGSGADPVASPASSAGCPAGQYHYAEPIQLTAAPARGWRVLSWTNTSHDDTHDLTNSLLMPVSPLTVTVTYQEGLPGVLVVDAGFGFDSVAAFTNAVAATGRVYDVWNVAAHGNPDAATLAAYPRVIWYPGVYGGLSPLQESLLANYLNGGGSLFLSASDYIYNYGYTAFMQNYLGVGAYIQDLSYYTVTGQGPVFSGLGPYFLTFTAYSDQLSPGPGAAAAFQWQGTILTGSGDAAVSHVGPNYRTLFLGFPFEALPTPEARRDVMESSLDFLGTVFADVPAGHWAKESIEAVYRNGVTSGCSLNPRLYCPGGQVTRNKKAYFLLRAKEGNGYTPPPCTTQPFNDVPVSDSFCPWIQELVLRGITAGCGNGSYCPSTPVTREQMAFFLLRTLEGPVYTPPACTDPFKDVSPGSFFCPWIQELAHRGLTGGCGGGNYCPLDPVNRAQMATFLVTSFGLPVF